MKIIDWFSKKDLDVQEILPLCKLDEAQLSAIVLNHLMQAHGSRLVGDERFSVQFSLNPHNGEISAAIYTKQAAASGHEAEPVSTLG